MARTSEKPLLTYRKQRLKLLEKPDPYWHLIAEGQHLGYRKTGLTQGTWNVRYYSREMGKRRLTSLGTADDTAPANGTHVLSFQQALEAAVKWINSVVLADRAGIHIGPYKVKDAAADWLNARTCSEASKANSVGNLKHHILPTLGDIEVAKLTRKQVQDWLQGLAKKPPVKSLSQKSKTRFDANDSETKRKRMDTANRIFNDLSALLTLAYKNQHVASKAAWETVQKFKDVSVAKNEYLAGEEEEKQVPCCMSRRLPQTGYCCHPYRVPLQRTCKPESQCL